MRFLAHVFNSFNLRHRSRRNVSTVFTTVSHRLPSGRTRMVVNISGFRKLYHEPYWSVPRYSRSWPATVNFAFMEPSNSLSCKQSPNLECSADV